MSSPDQDADFDPNLLTTTQMSEYMTAAQDNSCPTKMETDQFRRAITEHECAVKTLLKLNSELQKKLEAAQKECLYWETIEDNLKQENFQLQTQLAATAKEADSMKRKFGKFEALAQYLTRPRKSNPDPTQGDTDAALMQQFTAVSTPQQAKVFVDRLATRQAKLHQMQKDLIERFQIPNEATFPARQETMTPGTNSATFSAPGTLGGGQQRSTLNSVLKEIDPFGRGGNTPGTYSARPENPVAKSNYGSGSGSLFSAFTSVGTGKSGLASKGTLASFWSSKAPNSSLLSQNSTFNPVSEVAAPPGFRYFDVVDASTGVNTAKVPPLLPLPRSKSLRWPQRSKMTPRPPTPPRKSAKNSAQTNRRILTAVRNKAANRRARSVPRSTLITPIYENAVASTSEDSATRHVTFALPNSSLSLAVHHDSWTPETSTERSIPENSDDFTTPDTANWTDVNEVD